jgi:hypothetical protein
MILKNKRIGLEFPIALAVTNNTLCGVTPCSPVVARAKLSKQEARRKQQNVSEMKHAILLCRGDPDSRPGLVKWDLWWTKCRRG